MPSKAKLSSRKRRITILRIAILIGAVAVLLGVISYRLYQISKVGTSFQQMEQIQKETSEKLAPLSKDFEQFQAHPELAKKMKPKFKKAQRVLAQAVISLKALDTPQELAKLKHDLILLDTKSAIIYKDLVKLADYLVEREKVIDQFVKATESFDKSAKGAKTNEDIIKAGKILREDADRTVKQLEQLKSPIRVYSNQLLVENLKELSSSLSLLEEGIGRNDVAKIEQAASQLGKLFSKDWTGAIFQEDRKNIEKYEARVKEINRLYEQVQQDMIEYSKGKK